ncbi:hypothetical protein [Legionella shakespearei]|uniref:Uncharacterized protein n=1 Tax=Legionella shakespearei DSM 23087 TaxID=1122169 RepID=A0A0W0YUG3_9GAMM|nr:hypothetical protein [Legionella shakespearei]KTD60504.1 hypothetical protein Lsha_1600 [Legionella shakespearei DSM 23087]
MDDLRRRLYGYCISHHFTVTREDTLAELLVKRNNLQQTPLMSALMDNQLLVVDVLNNFPESTACLKEFFNAVDDRGKSFLMQILQQKNRMYLSLRDTTFNLLEQRKAELGNDAFRAILTVNPDHFYHASRKNRCQFLGFLEKNSTDLGLDTLRQLITWRSKKPEAARLSAINLLFISNMEVHEFKPDIESVIALYSLIQRNPQIILDEQGKTIPQFWENWLGNEIFYLGLGHELFIPTLRFIEQFMEKMPDDFLKKIFNDKLLSMLCDIHPSYTRVPNKEVDWYEENKKFAADYRAAIHFIKKNPTLFTSENMLSDFKALRLSGLYDPKTMMLTFRLIKHYFPDFDSQGQDECRAIFSSAAARDIMINSPELFQPMIGFVADNRGWLGEACLEKILLDKHFIWTGFNHSFFMFREALLKNKENIGAELYSRLLEPMNAERQYGLREPRADYLELLHFVNEEFSSFKPESMRLFFLPQGYDFPARCMTRDFPDSQKEVHYKHLIHFVLQHHQDLGFDVVKHCLELVPRIPYRKGAFLREAITPDAEELVNLYPKANNSQINRLIHLYKKEHQSSCLYSLFHPRKAQEQDSELVAAVQP